MDGEEDDKLPWRAILSAVATLSVLAVVCYVVMMHQGPQAPRIPPPPTAEDQMFEAQVTAERVIKAILRDPDSAVFEPSKFIFRDQQINVCGRYRARNGFGGMNRSRFIYKTRTHELTLEENNPRFADLAWVDCQGPASPAG